MPRLICALIGTLLVGAGTSISAEPAQTVVRASSTGAKLDTDLMKGGGTDDTAALQAVLDRAAKGKPVHLIIDGAALITGLNVHGRTTLECIHGGGLYLKDGSSRALIRNAHRSKQAIVDEHITIRGCFLNGNREHQPSADLPLRIDIPCCKPSNKEADGTFISGVEFLGVNNLTIENTTVWKVRAFGVLIANASRIAIKNLTIDYGSLPGIVDRRELNNNDGLVFKGPLQYATVDGLKVRVGDDGLALNADTWEDNANLYGPYVGVGPITDVTVNHVHFMDTILGVRFISASQRVDRVSISNVTGTVRGFYVANLSHWLNPSGLGNFGSIIFDNVNVDRSIDASTRAEMRSRSQSAAARDPGIAKLSKAVVGGMTSGDIPYFAVNAHIEHLNLRNVVTKVTDDRPILWLGPDAHIQTLNAELTLLDPSLQAIPLQLDQGSHIERLAFHLRWNGQLNDEGKDPIVSLGGTIGQLHWVNTPPSYERAALMNGKSVVVRFTQDVKALDFKSGVTIKIDGKPAEIARVAYEPGRNDTVRYVLKESARDPARVTWSYDALAGSIANFSGTPLLSVSEKSPLRASESRLDSASLLRRSDY